MDKLVMQVRRMARVRGFAVITALLCAVPALASKGGIVGDAIQTVYRRGAMRHVREGTVINPYTDHYRTWQNMSGLHGAIERMGTGYAVTRGGQRPPKLPRLKTLTSSKKVDADRANEDGTWKMSVQWGKTEPYTLANLEADHPLAGKQLTSTPIKLRVAYRAKGIRSRSERQSFIIPKDKLEVTFTRIMMHRSHDRWDEVHVYRFHREGSGETPADVIIMPDRPTPLIIKPGHTPLRTAARALLFSTGLGLRPILLRDKDISRLPNAVQQAINSLRN